MSFDTDFESKNALDPGLTETVSRYFPTLTIILTSSQGSHNIQYLLKNEYEISTISLILTIISRRESPRSCRSGWRSPQRRISSAFAISNEGLHIQLIRHQIPRISTDRETGRGELNKSRRVHPGFDRILREVNISPTTNLHQRLP